MLAHLRNLFFSTDIPLRARRTYQRELLTAATMPVAMGLVEGEFLAVLAQKGFDAPQWIIATLIAAPMFSNLSSFFWARIAVGRKRVPIIVALMAFMLVLVATLALTPSSAIGLYQLTATTVAIRILLSGIITLRSTVWRHNYRRDQRAAITSRLGLIVMFISATLPALAGLWLDMAPQAFRIFYPVAALVGAVGVVSFSRVRVQGERAMLRFERDARPQPLPHGEGAVLYEVSDKISPGVKFMELLRKDRSYRQYMSWQFLLGSSIMMLKPVLVLAIIDVFDVSYRLSLLVFVLITLPLIMAMFSMPLWARLLDRIHVIRFRQIQSTIFIGAFLLLYLGMHWQLMAIVILAQAMQGIGRGGGILAWQLGHNDFASRHMVAAYMGTHVTLTGLRGLIAPYLGTLLYAGFQSAGIKGVGDGVFLIATGLAVIAALGFMSMRKQLDQLKIVEAAA